MPWPYYHDFSHDTLGHGVITFPQGDAALPKLITSLRGYTARVFGADLLAGVTVGPSLEVAIVRGREILAAAASRTA